MEAAQGEIHRWVQARAVQQGIEGFSTEEAVCVREVQSIDGTGRQQGGQDAGASDGVDAVEPAGAQSFDERGAAHPLPCPREQDLGPRSFQSP